MFRIVDVQGTRLKQLYEAAGCETLAEFARRAGVPYQTAQKHAQRDSIPHKWAVIYLSAARNTGADLAWLLSGSGKAPKTTGNIATVDRRENEMSHSVTGHLMDRAPPARWHPDEMLPIQEVLETEDGFMLTGKIVEQVPRPDYLSPHIAAFCIYMPTDDMAPRYERGDRLLINPALPVIPDKDVLLLSAEDADGRQRGLVRRLVRITQTTATVRSYNPDREVDLSRSDWPTLHRIDASRWR